MMRPESFRWGKRTMKSIKSYRALNLSYGIALALLLINPARGQTDDYAKLLRVAQAEGDEYVELRDALLEAHPAPWKIDEAVRYSWQAGLLVHILNARLAHPSHFKSWDKVEPSLSAALHYIYFRPTHTHLD